MRRIEGAIAFLRGAFRNVGAEGESVWLVCAELERARQALDKVKAALGDRLLAKGPLSEEYAHGIMRDIDNALGGELPIHPTQPIAPVPMLLWCPECGARHVDVGTFATKPHHTHACQECGMVWRPAIVATVGVRFLPGFKDAEWRDSCSYPLPPS